MLTIIDIIAAISLPALAGAFWIGRQDKKKDYQERNLSRQYGKPIIIPYRPTEVAFRITVALAAIISGAVIAMELEGIISTSDYRFGATGLLLHPLTYLAGQLTAKWSINHREL